MKYRGMPPFGLLAEKYKDKTYVLGFDGFIFTSPYVLTPSTARSSVAILLSVDSPSFLLGHRAGMNKVSGALVGSRVERSLAAVDVKLISINVSPSHPAFHVLVKAATDKIVDLPRKVYSDYDTELEELYAGVLGAARIRALFENIISSVAAYISGLKPAGNDRQEILTLLKRQPAITLKELAQELGVSYAQASRLFCGAVGMPLRSFRHAHRLHACWNGFSQASSLTRIAYDAGFADSAHFTRAWRHAYGMPPSYVFKQTGCDIVAVEQ